jgi:Mannosyltransferase (PIG-V)
MISQNTFSRSVVISTRDWLATNAVPLGVFAASRVGLGLLMYLSLALLPMRDGTFWRAYPDNLLLDGWVRWDAAWYRDIAEHGYTNTPSHEQFQRDTAFFPLYPLLMRALHVIIPDLYICGLLISNIAFLGALILIYRFTCARFDSGVAQRAIVLLSIFPFSFFFSAVYSESLYLLAAAGAFVLGEQRRWAWAALSAAAAGATRLVGVVTVFGLLLLYLDQISFERRRVRANILWLLVGLLGTLGFMLFLTLRFGNPLQFVDSQYVPGWGAGMGLDAAWSTIRALSPAAVLAGRYSAIDVVHLLILPLALALAALAARKLSLAYAAWSIATLLISFALWRSMGRFVAVTFPIFIVAAVLLEHRRYQVAVYISLLLLALFTIMYAHFYWVA